VPSLYRPLLTFGTTACLCVVWNYPRWVPKVATPLLSNSGWRYHTGDACRVASYPVPQNAESGTTDLQIGRRSTTEAEGSMKLKSSNLNRGCGGVCGTTSQHRGCDEPAGECPSVISSTSMFPKWRRGLQDHRSERSRNIPGRLLHVARARPFQHT
jgi:hypothetical protein